MINFSRVMKSLLKEAVDPDSAKYNQFRQDQMKAGVNRNDIPEFRNWRQQQGNNQSIQNSIKYVANMHSSSVCEVRRQIDNYRLENLLEDTNEQNK